MSLYPELITKRLICTYSQRRMLLNLKWLTLRLDQVLHLDQFLHLHHSKKQYYRDVVSFVVNVKLKKNDGCDDRTAYDAELMEEDEVRKEDEDARETRDRMTLLVSSYMDHRCLGHYRSH